MYEILKLIHLIAAVVWLGGMTFMIFALKPALLGLEPNLRAPLMVAVWKRFFALVLASIVVILLTGTHMYTAGFRAAKAASAAAGNVPVSGGVPLGWNVMLVTGLLMILLFGHIYFAGFKKFQRAVAAADWPLAGRHAGLVQKMVLANFVLGWLGVLAVRLLR